MGILDGFKIAFDSLRKHKLRSALTLIGIIIGVASIIGIMTAIDAIQAYMEDTLSVLGTSVFQVQKYPAVQMGHRDRFKYRNRKDIKIEHADAGVLADQIAEIYGAEAAATSASPTARRARSSRRGTTPTATATPVLRRVRILTDTRTNSLIVLASRSQMDDIRELVAKLDVPVIGGGRIHVYYLNHANAEELAQTLNALISGQPVAPRAAAGAVASELHAFEEKQSPALTRLRSKMAAAYREIG